MTTIDTKLEAGPEVVQLAKLNNRNLRVAKLYLLQDRRCHFCGIEMLLHVKFADRNTYATVDHLTARSKGGTRSNSNTVCACAKCNRMKATMTAGEFLQFGAASGYFARRAANSSTLFGTASTAANPVIRGWLCPRCDKANAPWVAQCGCSAAGTGDGQVES